LSRVGPSRSPGHPVSLGHGKRTEAVDCGNLPVELSSFVGRGRELAEVKRLLSSTHVITLTGPGRDASALAP
jgi:hypothetical protein